MDAYSGPTNHTEKMLKNFLEVIIFAVSDCSLRGFLRYSGLLFEVSGGRSRLSCLLFAVLPSACILPGRGSGSFAGSADAKGLIMGLGESCPTISRVVMYELYH